MSTIPLTPRTSRLLVVGAIVVILAAAAPWALTLSSQELFYALGHLSFAITFLAYAQKDLIKLRLIAITSLVVGLIYNSYVHANMPPGQNLWPVLLWMGLFLIQNIINSVREVSRSMEIAIPAHERLIQASAFPQTHSRDWALLSQHAQKKILDCGEVILKKGQPTDSLQMLVYGAAQESRDDQQPIRRRLGALWGELTWVLGRDMFNSSPCDVTITSDTAEVWTWRYETLDKLCAKNDRLAAALKDGFIRSASFKHGLLIERSHDTAPFVESARSVVSHVAVTA